MAPIKRKSVVEPDSPNKKPRPAQSATSNVSIFHKDEPAFPRGGASVLTPLEHKQIHIKARQDVLFEQSTGQKSRAFDSEDEENAGDDSGEEDDSPAMVRRKPANKSKSQKLGKVADNNGIKIEGLSYKVCSTLCFAPRLL